MRIRERYISEILSNTLKKKFRIVFIIIFVIVFVFISCRKFVFTSKPILWGEFVNSTNFSKLYEENSQIFNPDLDLGRYNAGIPISTGNEDVFGTARGVKSSYWLLLLSILQQIFSGFADKIYVVIAIILPFFSMFFLMKNYLGERKNIFFASIISACIYAVNPWIALRIMGGFLQLNLAYGIFPLLYIIVNKLLNQNLKVSDYLKISLISSILILFLFILSPQFLVIFLITLPVIAVFQLKKLKDLRRIKRILCFCFAVIILFFLMSLYYWIPGILYKDPSIIQSFKPDYFAVSSVRFNGIASTIVSLFRLSPVQIISLSPLQIFLQYLYILPLLLIFTKKRTIYMPFICIYLLGLFLAKGVNEPFQNVSIFLYQNIPLLYPFRDPTQFVPLLCFSLAILWGFFFTILQKNISYVIFFLFIIWTIIVNPIYFSGNFADTIIPFTIPNSYFRIDEWFAKQPGDFRVLYLPNRHPLSDYLWYPKSNNASVNLTPYHALIPFSKPLADGMEIGFFDTYSLLFRGYLHEHLSEASLSAVMLNKTNTKYIILDSAFNNNTVGIEEYNEEKNWIQANKYLEKVITVDNLTVYRNTLYKNYALTSATIIPVVGNLTAYNYLLPCFSSNTSLLFLNQPANIDLLSTLKDKNIYFFNQTANDLIGDSLENRYDLDTIAPTWEQIPPKWSTYNSFGTYFQSLTEEDGVLFTSGQTIAAQESASLHIPFTENANSSYILLVNVLENENRGQILFDFDNKKRFFINTNSFNKTSLNWKVLGEADIEKGKHILTLASSKGNEFVIDGIEVVPVAVYKKEKNTIANILKQNKPIYINGTNTSLNDCPTDELQGEVYLYSYSPYWEVNNKKSFIGDYYANIFLNEKNKHPKFIAYSSYPLLYTASMIVFISILICIIISLII